MNHYSRYAEQLALLIETTAEPTEQTRSTIIPTLFPTTPNFPIISYQTDKYIFAWVILVSVATSTITTFCVIYWKNIRSFIAGKIEFISEEDSNSQEESRDSDSDMDMNMEFGIYFPSIP